MTYSRLDQCVIWSHHHRHRLPRQSLLSVY